MLLEDIADARARPATDGKIFFVIPRAILDRYQGGGQRTATIFEALRDLAPVTVIVLGEEPFDAAWTTFPGAEAVVVLPEFDLSEGAHRGWRRATRFFAKYFRPAGFYRPNPRLAARLEEIGVGTGPAVVVFRTFAPFAASDLRADPDRGLFVIVDVDDRDDQKAETRLRALFGDRAVDTILKHSCVRPLARLFHARLRDSSEAWFVAPQDAAIEHIRSRVIENAAFDHQDDGTSAPPSASRDILFVGPAFFPPNVNGVRWFLQECWPAILRRSPDTRFRIVGGGDWRRVADEHEGRGNIDVTGFVDDLAAEYRTSRLAICPLNEGGGSKVKLIEACAFGRPVVATPHSTRGFSAELTGHILAGDTASAFADACVRLIEHPDKADRRGATLREVQQRRYSKNTIRARIAEAVGELMAPRTGA